MRDCLRKRVGRLACGLVAIVGLSTLMSRPLHAFNFVVDANGTWWGIQDGASPFVDTGSVSLTQLGPFQGSPLVTTLNGFGGLKVRVEATPSPRFNGELMRGFGLTFDGRDTFNSARSINLGGVVISRRVSVPSTSAWGRWLDTFTNTTGRPLTIRVAFGGQSGIGASGANTSAIVSTSSGDIAVTAADSWVEVATPTDRDTPVGGPQVTVLGTPDTPSARFAGALTFAGNWQSDRLFCPQQLHPPRAQLRPVHGTLSGARPEG